MAVGYAYSVLGDWQQAEDAAQEAFIRAYYSLHSLRDAAAFPGWFRRIVFTESNRTLRSRRSLTVSLDQVAEVAVATGFNVSDLIEQRELTDAIYAAVNTLPDKQRDAILLYYMSGFSQQEVAVFLDVPVATIKTRLHYARKQLKQRIEQLNEISTQRPSRNNAFTEKVMRLFEATKNGDTEHVRAMLAEQSTLAQASGFIKTAVWAADAHALHVAVMHGRKDIVDMLLEHGADINARDEKYRFTALMHAIDLADFMPDYAELNMVEFLLERGAEKTCGRAGGLVTKKGSSHGWIKTRRWLIRWDRVQVHSCLSRKTLKLSTFCSAMVLICL